MVKEKIINKKEEEKLKKDEGKRSITFYII